MKVMAFGIDIVGGGEESNAENETGITDRRNPNRAHPGGYSRRDALSWGVRMDGATDFSTEVGVGVSVVQVKFVAAKEVELVDGEAKFPRDVSPMEGGRFDFLWGFSRFSSMGMRHGTVFKVLSEWVCL